MSAKFLIIVVAFFLSLAIMQITPTQAISFGLGVGGSLQANSGASNLSQLGFSASGSLGISIDSAWSIRSDFFWMRFPLDLPKYEDVYIDRVPGEYSSLSGPLELIGVTVNALKQRVLSNSNIAYLMGGVGIYHALEHPDNFNEYRFGLNLGFGISITPRTTRLALETHLHFVNWSPYLMTLFPVNLLLTF